MSLPQQFQFKKSPKSKSTGRSVACNVKKNGRNVWRTELRYAIKKKSPKQLGWQNGQNVNKIAVRRMFIVAFMFYT